jgi:hypothetical protein
MLIENIEGRYCLRGLDINFILEHSINIHLGKVGSEEVGCVQMALDAVQLHAVVKTKSFRVT